MEGIRILDFTWVRSGPWATRWLAILGADIIKVEWPEPALGMYTGRLVSGNERTTPPRNHAEHQQRRRLQRHQPHEEERHHQRQD